MRATACSICGGSLTVAWWDSAILVPFLAATALAPEIHRGWGWGGVVVGCTMGLAAGVGVKWWAVPLVVARQRRRPAAFALMGILVAATIAVSAMTGKRLGKAVGSTAVPPPSLTTVRFTDHLEIHTDLGEGGLEHYVAVFEGFWTHFEEAYFPVGQHRRLRMFLFGDETAFSRYAAEHYQNDTRFGFYVRGQNLIVVNTRSGLGTTTHELVHHFVATGFAVPPPEWVDEGFAAFFEKFIGRLEPDGRLVLSFGYFSNWRFPVTKVLAENGDVSLEELFAATQADQCVARALMLFLHKRGSLKRFILKTSAGGAAVAALEETYGKSIGEIEHEWLEWIDSQPVNDDVHLVEASFVKLRDEWDLWWQANRERLYWSDDEGIYRVRPAAARKEDMQ